MIYLLDGLKTLTGNYGWAIIIFAAIVKAALYFPTQSQFKQMKEMQKVQPAMKKLQERYKGDPQKLQVEQMALFKKYNVNPLAGCLPILIQMPILIGIYATIRKMAELGRFANETFLWIGGPLSNIYPSLFGGSLAHKDTLLLVIYGFSMYLSQKMSVGVSDPSNESTQKIMGLAMPVMFTVFLWNFPSSLILYWLVFNILSVAQQYFTMRDAGTAGQEIQESTPDEADTAPDADMETPQGRSRSRSRKKKGGN
jgi:YidC/Oxa1 family membrane protein insertase